MATGSAAAGCQIDVRVMQTITLALNTLKSVGVSDLNRQCTCSLLGAGEESSHWVKSGGLAVDFDSLSGNALDGSTPDNMALFALLSTVAPDGTRIGQAQCRNGETWPNLSQIDDGCNHQHIDCSFTDSPLNFISEPEKEYSYVGRH
ncbi:hypothetical protein [Cryobacterium zongtaii]|nr:hypothetical protein [Cryobacterium zongtaii]